MTDAVNGFEALRKICIAVLRGEPVPLAFLAEPGFAEQGYALAERHHVFPLVYAGLEAWKTAGAAPTGAAATGWHRRMLVHARKAIRYEQVLAALAGRLAAANVEFLVVKGPVLARQAYPVPVWRGYDDLDIRVRSKDLLAVVRILAERGYSRSVPLDARGAACARRAGIEAAMVQLERASYIDVAHGWRSLAPSRRAADEIWDEAVAVEIAGGRVRAPRPEHALLLACAHGAHHRWDRLVWVADVAGLWGRLSPAARTEACALARRWRMETMLGLGLGLAAAHLDATMDGRAAELVAAPRVRSLAARVPLAQVAPDTPHDEPLIDCLRFERDAQDTAFRRLRMKAYWLFTPTLADIRETPLPSALYPLYALVRPFRLLRHPWLRDWRKLAGWGESNGRDNRTAGDQSGNAACKPPGRA